MTVHIITVGDEILIGQIVDTNSAWMGQQLNQHGAHIIEISSVGDEAPAISQALTSALAQADVVLMTGGLGPTKDDITKKVLADFMGVPLALHEATYERIQRFFERLGRSANEAHRQQCFLPTNTTVLTNKMGTAPGMWFEHQGKIIVSMPGVPYEMKYLMEHEVIPRLKDRLPFEAIQHCTLLTAGEGESRIAELIADIEDSLPPHIKLAYLPNLGQVRLRLSGRSDDAAALQHDLAEQADRIRGRLGQLIFGEGDDTLEAAIGRLLQARQLMLGTAESCTGGHIAHRITSVPGSSAYFQGSIVAYANEVKQSLLGVSASTLAAHGAVSEHTVREMVAGALQALGVDVAIAISGIAGPDGGTPEKPVGTIWIAVGNRDRIVAHKLQAGKARLQNILFSTTIALNVLRQFLLEAYPLGGDSTSMSPNK